jgi:flagellin
MQGTALNTTMTLGTQTITDRTATTAGADLSATIVAAGAYANTSITGTADKISYIQNATIDAINSNQKLSFAAKADALDSVATLVNMYTSPNTVAPATGITLLGAYTTATGLAQDLAGALSSSTTSYALVGAKSTYTAAAITSFQADAGGNTTKKIDSAITSGTLTFTMLNVANGTGAGQVGATQTAASGQSLALSAITALDNALTEVNTASSIQGALQNRFSAVISNLTAFSQSQTAAKSRIVDADFAAETAKLSKNQILQQAGTAMLAQANQLPSSVLSLLK